MEDIRCFPMDRTKKMDAFELLTLFLRQDEFYLAASEVYGDAGPQGLDRALELFLTSPETGFVWLAYLNGKPSAVCVICYAISTSIGTRVAKVDDVFVRPEYQHQGVATTMIRTLAETLRKEGVRRIDTAVHAGNRVAEEFYGKLGFQCLREERLAWVLEPVDEAK